VLMPGVQSNSIAAAVNNAFSIPTWATGLFLVLVLGLIIFGGIKWIANTAAFIVPFMAIGYMLMAAVIIFMNLSAVPETIALIFRSAFGMDSLFGGLLGSAISWGVMRGVYSNEAGQGTGAHPAAAAEVSHPAKQGLVQAASVYIDTLLVCSATAFMILFTGMYNTQGPEEGKHVFEAIPGVEAGPQFTQEAINQVFPAFGTGFVAIALLFFAFTTIMAYYYIAETNIAYLMRGRNAAWPMVVIKLLLLGATYYGANRTAANAWLLGDIGLGLMVWINIIAIVLLAKPAMIALKDYEAQKQQGLDPVFNPKKLGIKHATFWETYEKGPEKNAS
jgi:alanine or glycine:cation symporter, AGCS family